MTKQSFLGKYSILFLIPIILSVGCNNENDADKSPTTSDTGKTTTEPVTRTTVTVLSGKLDVLWVDSLKFAELPKGKTVFAFIFGNNDTLTLHGWNAKGILENGFDSLPDIRLIKGNPSELSYGPGTYFGNVILLRNEVKIIKKMLDTSHKKYVLFVPHKLGEHIRYDIFLSNDNIYSETILVKAIPTNIVANPSPPKQY